MTALAVNSHDLERNRISALFRQSMAMVYLERTEGTPGNALPWSDYEAVWSRAFPDTPDGWSLIRRRPEVVVQHFFYQAGVAIRVLAADVLRVDDPMAFLAACALWGMIHLASGGSHRIRLSSDVWFAMLALLVLVPLSCVYFVAARNLLQLVPAAVIMLILGAHYALSSLFRFWISPGARPFRDLSRGGAEEQR
jgi:hypothetical protein